VDLLSNDSNEVTDQSTLSLIKLFIIKSSRSNFTKLLDLLISSFSTEIDQTRLSENPLDHEQYRSHKLALEIYSFLISWLVQVGEKLQQQQQQRRCLCGR